MLVKLDEFFKQLAHTDKSGSRQFVLCLVCALMLLIVDHFLFVPIVSACGSGTLKPYFSQPPNPTNRYRVCPNDIGWQSIAVRSYFVVDNNLRIIGFPASSALPVSELDIVLIDGNHAGFDQYTFEVFAFGPTQNYYIEYAPSTAVLEMGQFGPYTTTISSTVRTWDLYLESDSEYYVMMEPSTNINNIDMALFESVPSNQESYFQSRAESRLVANPWGSGQTKQLVFKPDITDIFGLIVWTDEEHNPFSYNLYVDSSPPNGNLQINNGAQLTNTRNIMISLGAFDDETGIREICLNEEANPNPMCFVPDDNQFEHQIEWELSENEGLKTITATVINHAGMSKLISDSIEFKSGDVDIERHLTFLPLTLKQPTLDLPVTCSLEPNDLLSEAREHGSLEPNFSYCGKLEDDLDFYFLNLSGNSTVKTTVNLGYYIEDISAMVRLVIYDAETGDVLASKINNWDEYTLSIQKDLLAGEYYFLIQRITLNGEWVEYTIEWSNLN